VSSTLANMSVFKAQSQHAGAAAAVLLVMLWTFAAVYYPMQSPAVCPACPFGRKGGR